MKKRKTPRIFYGWFVLVGAAIISTIGYSMRYSFSVFYPEILNEFGWSRAETAAAFSVSMLVYGISSPVIGTLTDKFGPRRVLMFGTSLLATGLLAISQMNNIWLFYFLFGIIMAVGINALGFPVHFAYLPNWFVRKRGLAFGILMAGAGAASVMVSLYQYLILVLGWRATYGVLSAIVLAVIMPLTIFVIRGAPQEKGMSPDGTVDSPVDKGASAIKEDKADLLIVDRKWAATEWTLAKALRTHRLWFMFLMLISLSLALNLVLAHQPIYSQDKGFSAIFAASIFGLTGVTTVIGNLNGFISDRIGREITYTISITGSIIGVSALMLATPSQSWLLYLYATVWGIFFGIGGPIGPSANADMFSGKHFGAINGFCTLGFGIGGAIGPWLGGYIFDATNSYTIAFIIVMIALALACTFLWLAAPRQVRVVIGKTPKAGTS